MKIFLITLLAVLALPSTVEANWFGYGSSFEAMRACQSWNYKNKNKKIFRRCVRDEETNQVVGIQNSKVKKRFKY